MRRVLGASSCVARKSLRPEARLPVVLAAGLARRVRSAARLLAAACLVLGSTGPAALAGELPLEARVPRMDRPLAQLAHARRLKQAMYARTEDDRPFWRGLAVEAYLAVGSYHPQAAEVVAEAAFRAGELLRAGGRGEEAVEAFSIAVSRGKGTAFRARAKLEIGHVWRRKGDDRRALDQFLSVASDSAARQAHRDDAWLWAGRIWHRAGRFEDAHRAWRGVAEGAGDPLDRIQAYDEWILSLHARSESSEASFTLQACSDALADRALEETQHGERVRSALARMRARVVLEEKRDSSGSARRSRKP